MLNFTSYLTSLILLLENFSSFQFLFISLLKFYTDIDKVFKNVYNIYR